MAFIQTFSHGTVCFGILHKSKTAALIAAIALKAMLEGLINVKCARKLLDSLNDNANLNLASTFLTFYYYVFIVI